MHLFVLASLVGAEMCSDQTDKIWGYWWEHSVVGMIGVPPVPLDHLVFICWLLTFLQQVVPCVTWSELELYLLE